MAEPARQFDENLSGNADSAPPGRTELKALEGGGETSEPNRSWYKGDKKEVDQDDLSGLENGSGGSDQQVQHENPVGSGYKKAGPSNSSNRKRISWLLRNRRAVFGGGAISSAIAIVLFFVSSGPLQFVHLAHLLEQWHFSTQQDQQDDRFMKEARYLRYSSSGEVEKTRLGYLGNKLTDTFESKLNAAGYKSAYSTKFGLFDGYLIDKNNEKFKGKSDEEIKKIVKSETGLDAINGESVRTNLKGEIVISAKGLGYFKTKGLNTAMLTQAKYSKVPASVGARMMCKRAGCTLHPLKLLSGKAKSALEDWWSNRNKADKEGQSALTTKDGETPPDQHEADAQEVNDNNSKANQAVNDTNTDAQNAADDPSKIEEFKSNLSGRILGGGAQAIGILCTVKGINEHSGEIKQAQVIFPLERVGTEMMGVGNQIESGQDLSTDALGKYNTLMHGKDSSGKNTSWNQAQSILAEEGHGFKGNVGKPDNTLLSIGQGVPFDFVNQGILGTALAPTCSTGGIIATSIIQIGLDFTGVGGLISQVGSGVVESIASGPILNQIAHWMAGSAVDVTSTGADFGNIVNFGAKLASNDQALAAGGRALSNNEFKTLAAFENSQAEQKFQKHSLSYKLLNPYDERSAFSRIIDNTSPDPGQNIAKMTSVFTNFGRLFNSVPALISHHAYAAAGSYDYGFSTFGFSQNEMDDPAVENPFENACYVVGCHDSTASNSKPKTPIITAAADTSNNVNISGIFEDPAKRDTYTKMAKDCFGISIDQDGNGQWNATDSGDKPPNPYDSKYPDDCKNTSDPDWQRVRFFITDTEVMNSAACYAGKSDDQDTMQACTDVGFDQSQSQDASSGDAGSSDNGSAVSGDAQQLAQQILKNNSIVLAGRYVPEDIQNTAKGQPAYSNVKLDVGILQFLLDAAKHGNVVVTSITGAGSGHSGPSSNHYSGHAVDLGCTGVGTDLNLLNQIASKYNGSNNGERCDRPNPYGYPPHDHYDFFSDGNG
jgi:hypothetical protein